MHHMLRVLLLLGLLALQLQWLASPAAAVRFLLRDTTPVCFVEEAEEHTKVISGECARSPGGASVPVRLLITDPEGRVVMEQALKEREEGGGGEAFSASLTAGALPGQYLLCVRVTQPGWEATSTSGGIAIDFTADQSTAAAAVVPSGEATVRRQKVDGLEVFTFRDFGGQQKDMLRPAEFIHRVEKGLLTLNTLVHDAREEMNHLIGRFARMRRTSESTYTRIWAFGIITVAVMVIVTWLQFRFLKSTLRHKKLV